MTQTYEADAAAGAALFCFATRQLRRCDSNGKSALATRALERVFLLLCRNVSASHSKAIAILQFREWREGPSEP